MSGSWLLFLVQHLLILCEIRCQTTPGFFEMHEYGAVYIDGRLVARAAFLMDGTNVTFEVSGQLSVLSVEVVGNQTLFSAGLPPFIIGFYGNSVTGQHWRCSSKKEPHWTSPNFDDSSWKSAFIPNDTIFADLRTNEPSIAMIPPNAHFIWSHQPNAPIGGYAAFCRLKLPTNGLQHQIFSQAVPLDVGGQQMGQIQAASEIECSIGCLRVGRCLCSRHVHGASWTNWTCARKEEHAGCCSFYWLRSSGQCILFDSFWPDVIRSTDWSFYGPSINKNTPP